jgi:large subunit ribosomal protein LP0
MSSNRGAVKNPQKKYKVYEKTQSFLNKFTTVLVCDIKDMPSNNIHKMRKQLRTLDSEVLCGKSTIIEKAVKDLISGGKFPSHLNTDTLTKLADCLATHQLCIIFTNQDIGEITKVSDQFKLEKQSKVGAISPVEIILPAGPTGMDASQVDYFQNLRIQTKVVKNQLDIINPTKILSVGQKITLSEINLMNKFGIKPFHHKIKINNVIIGGKIFDSGILNLNAEIMKKALDRGIQNIAAFGLSSGISNKASAVHVVANSFRNIMGLAVGCGVEIKQVKGLLQAATEVKKAPVVEKKEEPKKEEKKDTKKKQPEPEPEEDDMPMGLF